MQVFRCSVCKTPVYFENYVCTSCGHKLAFLPNLLRMRALEPEAAPGDQTVFITVGPRSSGQRYRMCRNASLHHACNWAIPADSASVFCSACELNEVIPDLSSDAAVSQWKRLEAAKRRLLYTLLWLKLDVVPRHIDRERGLSFSFLADQPGHKVYTGHANGLITINVAEANPSLREHAKSELEEPYRTLLGHFRHEVGHYYWDRLICDTPRHDAFRKRFGDERADYASARARHYEGGAPEDWSEGFVSAYATMHPWEDWAETWAHYLHMVDTLETARGFGLTLTAPSHPDNPPEEVDVSELVMPDFDDLIRAWMPLTLALNSLNRSMGHADAYPFALAPTVIDKLRFVHETIRACRGGGRHAAGM